jgi:regulator of protease activity HflC (stomatin/prohibitin superfamily)
VITRDNATAYLDAILSYKITNPKQMIYSCNNLPDLLSKLLQAALRNVAGSLELDQIIEDSGTERL